MPKRKTPKAKTPKNQTTRPADPARVNPGTAPGESFGERWTNKVYSTPDPDAENRQDADGGKHHEPTPFLRG
ncbi:MAG: hypothetical protein JWP29_1338 [Rhodoferax sp.]|nr:hypothetical protein [Rhodoferax sp.]